MFSRSVLVSATVALIAFATQGNAETIKTSVSEVSGSITVSAVYEAGTTTPVSADIFGFFEASCFFCNSEGDGETTADGFEPFEGSLEIGEALEAGWTVTASAGPNGGRAAVTNDANAFVEVFNFNDFPIDVIFEINGAISGAADNEDEDGDAFASAFIDGFLAVPAPEGGDPEFIDGFFLSGLAFGNPAFPSFEENGDASLMVTLQGGQIATGELFGSLTAAAAVVPVPGAVWLFGSALGAIGWFRRRAG